MATTNIELDIENITGVSDADDQFIISAQKFVVSSVPKNLLRWAQNASSASTDGSAISFTTTDSILDVQRNGYSCREISLSDSKWALDSSSLKYATAHHPVWYHKQGAVHFAPVTDGSNAGYVFYVDFSKIDDACDLRNAVIFHAASSEFSKLGSAEMPTISISAPLPESPSMSENTVQWSTAEPTYTKPELSLAAVPSISDLTISAQAPDAPSTIKPGSTDYSVSFGTSAPTYTTPTQTISGIDWATEYPDGEVDLSTALSAIATNVDLANSTLDNAPVPPEIEDVPDFSISYATSLPTYTSPTVGGATEELTATMDSDSSGFGTDADFLNFSKWFSVASHLIEDEEDTELAQTQLQKISTYINSYSTAVQESIGKFNSELQSWQAGWQKALEEDKFEKENEFTAKLQKYSNELNQYSNEINLMSQQSQGYLQTAQGYVNEVSSKLQVTQTKIQEYQSKVQDALNTFNKENAEYQAQLQISIQNAQLESQADAHFLQKYSNQLQSYQADVNKEVQQYQQNLEADLQAWQIERTTDLQKYQADIQNELNKFNKKTTVYQAELQERIKEADLKDAKESRDLQNYANQIQEYASLVQSEVAEYQNKLQKQQLYSAESKKYYEWAKMEIANFVQNNEKMLGVQALTQQRERAN